MFKNISLPKLDIDKFAGIVFELGGVIISPKLTLTEKIKFYECWRREISKD